MTEASHSALPANLARRAHAGPALALGLAFGAALAVAAPAGALAQDASSCQTTPAGGSTPQRTCGAAGAAGQVVQAAGPIILQRAGRVIELAAGEALRPGDRILARTGSARITLGGSCEVTLPPRSVSTIAAGGEGGLCLTQRDVGAVQAQSTPQASPRPATSGQSSGAGVSGNVRTPVPSPLGTGTGAAAGGSSFDVAPFAAAGVIGLLGTGVVVGASQSNKSRLSP
jgi:hypothetical protein